MWSQRVCNVRENCKGHLLQQPPKQQQQPPQDCPPPAWMVWVHPRPSQACWAASLQGEERRLCWEALEPHRLLFQTSTARRPLLFELNPPLSVCANFSPENATEPSPVVVVFNSLVVISLQLINRLHQPRPGHPRRVSIRRSFVSRQFTSHFTFLQCREYIAAYQSVILSPSI